MLYYLLADCSASEYVGSAYDTIRWVYF